MLLNKKDIVHRSCLRRIIPACVILLCLIQTLFSQTPPHPSLLEKVRNKSVRVPTFLVSNEANHVLSKSIVLSNASLVTGKINILVLMLDFPDKPHSVEASYFDSLIFSQEGRSLKNYFKEISYGSLDITMHDSPSSIGWIRAPHPFSYYWNPDVNSSDNSSKIDQLITDAIAGADSLIDLKDYDYDKDGYIDGLIVIHSGRGSEYTGNDNDIWSHSWIIPGYNSPDGVSLSRYVLCPEYYADPNGDMTIGTFAHELSHSLFGLPDLYDSDYSSNGLGKWSLMALGCWNGKSRVGGDMPAHPDAFSRIRFGFIKPVEAAVNQKGVVISPVETNASQVIKVWKEGDYKGKEYFLIENRQQMGFDESLPGHGLLVYHVDESQGSNSSEWYPGHQSGHYLSALIQADNKYHLELKQNTGDDGDPFPGSSLKNILSCMSKPDCRSYAGQDSRVMFMNIAENGQSIVTDIFLSAGKASITLLNVTGSEFLLVGSTYKIEWQSTDINKVNLEYSTDWGNTWSFIAENVDASLSSYGWVIPEIKSQYLSFRVWDADYPGIYSASSEFYVTTEPGRNPVLPEPGDIMFTELLRSSYKSGSYEFFTLKDLDLSTLQLTTAALNNYGNLVSNNADISLWGKNKLLTKAIPKGTLVRFEGFYSAGGYPSMPADKYDRENKIITFYYSNGVFPAGKGSVIAYRVTHDKVFYIAAIGYGNYWKNNRSPGTPADIQFGDENYFWFNSPVTGSEKIIKEALLNKNNWSVSNSAFSSTFKNKVIKVSELPVNLAAFTGQYYNNSIKLNWQTLLEQDNYGWEIQRRDETTDWEKAGFIEGSNNSSVLKEYSFVDNNIETGRNYFYRLKQLSTNTQEVNYSPNTKVSTDIPASFSLGQNFPNPFNNSTTIRFNLPYISHARLIITDLTGRSVREIDLGILTPGVYVRAFELGGLPSGVYFYTLISETYGTYGTLKHTKKLILLK